MFQMAINPFNILKSFSSHTVIPDPEVKFYYEVSVYYCNSIKQKQAGKVSYYPLYVLSLGKCPLDLNT